MKNESQKTKKNDAEALQSNVENTTEWKKKTRRNMERKKRNESKSIRQTHDEKTTESSMSRQEKTDRIETLLTLLVQGSKLAVEIRQNHYQGDDTNPWYKHVVILELTQFYKLVSMVEEKSKSILHLLENQQKYEKDNQHA